MGEAHQVGSDKTAEGHAENRRVVVRVLQNKTIADFDCLPTSYQFCQLLGSGRRPSNFALYCDRLVQASQHHTKEENGEQDRDVFFVFCLNADWR
jgi:hypothetical protein